MLSITPPLEHPSPQSQERVSWLHLRGGGHVYAAAQVVPVPTPQAAPPPAHQPEDIRRREQKRQATLAKRKPAPDPPPVEPAQAVRGDLP